MEKGLRILILEDKPADAELMERELRREQIEFSSKRVETKEAFLKELEAFSPDLILADYMLPGFNAMEALELVKERGLGMPVIIVTGSVSEEVAVECLKAGAMDYVIKGHLMRLGSAVKGALEKKRALKEKEWAVEELRKTASQWNDTFNAINDAVCLLDTDRTILKCNEAMSKLLGKPLSELIGKNCCELVHGSPEPIEGCPFLRMQKTLQRETVDFRIGDKIFNVCCDPVLDDSGNLTGAVHVINDITERKKIEEALKESESKLGSMLDSIGDHMSMMDKDLNILWANDVAKKIFGDDIIGKKCYATYHRRKEPCEPYPCLTLKAFQDGKTHEHDTEVIDKDGSTVYFHCTANVALRDKEGKPAAVLEISRDITERKKAEGALYEKNEALNRILESAPVPILTLDCEGKVSSIWNPAAEQILGWSRNEVLGKPYPAIPPGKEEEFAKNVKKTISGEGLRGVEAHRQRRDGTPIDYSIYTAPTHDKQGVITGLMAILLDITERKKAEEALRESENKYRTLLENLPQKIFLKDRDAAYISCNKNYAGDLKVGLDEIAGKTDYDFFPKELAEKYRADDKRIMAAGKGEDIEERYIQDGQEIWVHTVKTPIRGKDGKSEAILGIFWDITEQKKAGEELKKRTIELGERVKEMQCLNAVSAIASETALPLKEMINRVVTVIPSGWRYPEITCARIALDGYEARTENFKETPWRLAAGIIVDAKRIGAVEVFYLEERPEMDEGPFIKEERGLIDSIAAQVKAFHELNKKMSDLERFHKFAVGRELKMKEMKKEMEKLRERLSGKNAGGGEDE